MELDELKQHWNNTLSTARVPQALPPKALKQKMDAPLSRLRRKFRNRLILIPAVYAAYITELYFIDDPQEYTAYTYLVFWALAPFCTIMMAYFYVNYRVLVKLQQMDRPVKATLQQQLGLLEKLAWWRLAIFRGLSVLFMIVLEAVFYFSNDKRHLPSWSHHSISFRIGCYILLFTVFYFSSRFIIRYQYLRPVKRLKKILEQME